MFTRLIIWLYWRYAAKKDLRRHESEGRYRVFQGGVLVCGTSDPRLAKQTFHNLQGPATLWDGNISRGKKKLVKGDKRNGYS